MATPSDEDANRYRVTVRYGSIELRGYVDGYATLRAFADAVKPLGAIVMGSLAPPDYYPWGDEPVD